VGAVDRDGRGERTSVGLGLGDTSALLHVGVQRHGDRGQNVLGLLAHRTSPEFVTHRQMVSPLLLACECAPGWQFEHVWRVDGVARCHLCFQPHVATSC
jgi:hypothetical protein